MNVFSVFKYSKEYNQDVLDWFSSQEHLPVDMKILHDSQWQGWWSKMMLFSPHITGDILYFDIDTVFNGPIEKYKNLDYDYFLRDFYKPDTDIGSGVMYLKDNDIRRKVWNDWIENYNDIIEEFHGDQDFLKKYYFDNCRRWQDDYPGEILSFKADIRDSEVEDLSKCNIICYHGQPRPWQKETAYDYI